MSTFAQAIGSLLVLTGILVAIVVASGFIVGFICWLFGEGYSWGWW